MKKKMYDFLIKHLSSCLQWSIYKRQELGVEPLNEWGKLSKEDNVKFNIGIGNGRLPTIYPRLKLREIKARGN